jgi:hypothetical protein
VPRSAYTVIVIALSRFRRVNRNGKVSNQDPLAPATHLPNLVGSICARTETVAAFHMIRQFACRRCFASFDNTHKPHVVSLPNQ